RVPITGRVLSPNGFGIGGVRVVLSGDDPSETRAALTNGFGYYVFDDVEVGKAYIISPLDGRERFTWQGRFVLLTDQLSDVDFVAEP
ncbi:MAG TPA: carboxypeptidase-like regulatory domain-containing protein, partial [Pyrinomonadaceae bacterium]|nr:carboxypeptidase-like regulatory domain-containing protein [Pyrinomonadaceae bacterium]